MKPVPRTSTLYKTAWIKTWRNSWSKTFTNTIVKCTRKKPIYWLFASTKGAFQVLVYMHRMNAFTLEKIRDNYLIDHIKNLASEIDLLEKNEASLNTQEAKHLEQLRKNN